MKDSVLVVNIRWRILYQRELSDLLELLELDRLRSNIVESGALGTQVDLR